MRSSSSHLPKARTLHVCMPVRTAPRARLTRGMIGPPVSPVVPSTFPLPSQHHSAVRQSISPPVLACCLPPLLYRRCHSPAPTLPRLQTTQHAVDARAAAAATTTDDGATINPTSPVFVLIRPFSLSLRSAPTPNSTRRSSPQQHFFFWSL